MVLNEIASFFKIHNKSIADLTKMDINDLLNWFNELPKNLSDNQNIIGQEIIKEIKTRLG